MEDKTVLIRFGWNQLQRPVPLPAAQQVFGNHTVPHWLDWRVVGPVLSSKESVLLFSDPILSRIALV